MDNSPLAEWLVTVKPDIATQKRIVELLNERIGQCVIPGCSNVTLQDPDIYYTCFFCGKACCLAEHMAYIDLLERYCYGFLEQMDYPGATEVCSTCLAIVDAEYKLWLESPWMLHRDWRHKKFKKGDTF